jgi:hypothetical protein
MFVHTSLYAQPFANCFATFFQKSSLSVTFELKLDLCPTLINRTLATYQKWRLQKYASELVPSCVLGTPYCLQVMMNHIRKSAFPAGNHENEE